MPNGKGYTITVNGVTSMDAIPKFGVEVVRRRMYGQNRDVFLNVAGRAGAWRFAEKRGMRTIVIEAYVLADSFPLSRREELVKVADFFDSEDWLKMTISDEPDRFYVCSHVSEVEMQEWRELGRFELEFSAEPYAYALDLSIESGTIPMIGRMDDFSIDDAIDAYPVIEITPDADTTGLTLNCNGYILNVNAPVYAGTTITVTSVNYMVYFGENQDPELDGNFSLDLVTTADASGSFPVLLADLDQQEIDVNPELPSSDVNFEVTVTWRRRFR